MTYLDKYIAKSTSIASRGLGDETIVMSVLDSTLFTLNPTGTVIWEAADGKTLLSQIVEEKVCRSFEISSEQARADAEEFVGVLVERGLLLVSEAPRST